MTQIWNNLAQLDQALNTVFFPILVIVSIMCIVKYSIVGYLHFKPNGFEETLTIIPNFLWVTLSKNEVGDLGMNFFYVKMK